MILGASTHALIVEGTDDLYVIANVIQRERPELVDRWAPFIRTAKAKTGDDGAVGAAIREFGAVLQAAKAKRVGLVIDADSDVLQRWEAVRTVLVSAGVAADGLTDGGFLADHPDGRRVGAWLWPDNQLAGALEDFLLPLVPSSELRDYAHDVVPQAKSKGAPFTSAAEKKAVFRTWLAWQEQPGLPPGEAITRGIVTGRSPSLDAFAEWFDRLCIQD